MINYLGSVNIMFLWFKVNIFLVFIVICFMLSGCIENLKDENEILGIFMLNGFFGNM